LNARVYERRSPGRSFESDKLFTLSLYLQTGDVVDRDPPLDQRCYEGDPSVGEPPGYTQTPEQRRASANDRSRMQRQSGVESNSQGGRMSWYSRLMKKKWFGNGG